MRTAGYRVLAASAAGAGLLCAGCSSPARTSRTTLAPTTSSVPGTSSTTTTGVSTTGHCQPTGLTGTVVGTQGAAGTIEVTVELKNTSTSSCALEGYPGLQLVSAGGTQLPTSVVRGGSYSFSDFPPSPLTLAAGAVAYFNLGYSDVGSGTGSCPPASSMWVTPPDDVEHLVVAQSITACNGGTITVSPVFASTAPQTQTTAP